MGKSGKSGWEAKSFVRSLDDVYERMTVLLQSQLAKVISEEAKSCATLCRMMVAELRLGRSPLSGTMPASSAMVTKFVEKLPNLIVYKPGGSQAQYVYGAAALKKLHGDLKALSDDDRASKGLKAVEPFHLWNFLLEPGMRSKVERWTKMAHSKAGDMQAKKPARKAVNEPVSDGLKGKKEKKAKKEKEQLQREVDEMFIWAPILAWGFFRHCCEFSRVLLSRCGFTVFKGVVATKPSLHLSKFWALGCWT